MALSRALNSIKDNILAGKNLITNRIGFFPMGRVGKIKSNINQYGVNFGMKLLSAPLMLLPYIEAVLGDKIYMNETESNTTYEIEYRSAKLPQMHEKLLEYCQVVISNISSLDFNHTNELFCMKDGEKSGPVIDLSTEMGKNLTKKFSDCLEKAMQSLCGEYYCRREHEMRTILFTLMLGIFAIALIRQCLLKDANKTEKNETPHTSYSSSNYSTSSCDSASSYSCSNSGSCSSGVSVGWR